MRRAPALLLCAYLLAWTPFTYATELLTALPTLPMRGAPAALELAAHGIVAAVCAGAGWMVWMRAPAGPAFAAAAVVAKGAAGLQPLFWTALPSQLPPGARWPLAGVTVAQTLFWLVVVAIARRP